MWDISIESNKTFHCKMKKLSFGFYPVKIPKVDNRNKYVMRYGEESLQKALTDIRNRLYQRSMVLQTTVFQDKFFNTDSYIKSRWKFLTLNYC